MKIAIVGASGVLGRQVVNKIVQRLEDNKQQIDLTVVASKKSVGRQISAGDNHVLNLLALEAFLGDSDHYDILISALPRVVHEKWRSSLEGKAQKIIDLSGATSLEQDVVSLYDCVDIDLSQTSFSIVQSVSYGLIKLSNKLKSVLDVPVQRIVATAMMAASENGKASMDELYEQAKKAFVHQSLPIKQYDKQIAFNLLPRHGVLLSDRQNHQEWHIRSEFLKAMGKDVALGLTTVQVPVFIGTALSLTIEFDDEVLSQDVLAQLQEDSDFIVMDNRQFETYATPLDVASAPQILISRIREDWSHDTALNLWMCVDNLEIRSNLTADLIEAFIPQFG
mgnify:CR=1 FL=1